MKPDWNRLRRLAETEVEATLRSLPPRLRKEAGALPVTFEPRPGPLLVADGIEPDTLGLFVGPDFADAGGGVPMPPQIILFLENLWEFGESEEDWYQDEVHTTYLHELGHYLGLDEADLEQRGLD